MSIAPSVKTTLGVFSKSLPPRTAQFWVQRSSHLEPAKSSLSSFLQSRRSCASETLQARFTPIQPIPLLSGSSPQTTPSIGHLPAQRVK